MPKTNLDSSTEIRFPREYYSTNQRMEYLQVSMLSVYQNYQNYPVKDLTCFKRSYDKTVTKDFNHITSAYSILWLFLVLEITYFAVQWLIKNPQLSIILWTNFNWKMSKWLVAQFLLNSIFMNLIIVLQPGLVKYITSPWMWLRWS